MSESDVVSYPVSAADQPVDEVPFTEPSNVGPAPVTPTASSSASSATASPVNEPVKPATPTSTDKVKAFLAKADKFFRTYSYEVFLIAFVVAISAFTILFPRVALCVGAVLAAVSGWIAYYGLYRSLDDDYYEDNSVL